MDDPAKDGRSPACWSSSLGSLDVHYSSGPNNHMFYLLAEGGTSKCNGQSVTGIGREKAGKIWYKAIADYMTASTGYAGARTACAECGDGPLRGRLRRVRRRRRGLRGHQRELRPSGAGRGRRIGVTHLPLLSAAGLVLVASLACAASRPVEPTLDRDFEVAGGSSAQVDGTDLVIRFEAVPNDSRCPVDVQCITAGDATVALRVEGGGAEAQTIELHTLDEPREAAHGGYVVALVILRPRPVSTGPTPLGKYRATLRVRRSG